jgi:hypothetical protein
LVGLPIAKVTIGQDFFDLRRDVNNIAITKVTAQTRVLLQPPMMSALPPKADKLTHRNYPQKSKGRPKTHQPFVSAASHVRTGKGVKSCSSTAATTITTT